MFTVPSRRETFYFTVPLRLEKKTLYFTVPSRREI